MSAGAESLLAFAMSCTLPTCVVSVSETADSQWILKNQRLEMSKTRASSEVLLLCAGATDPLVAWGF